LRNAVETLTDCVVTVTNYKKDGTKFINQSSLFTVFESDSDCPHERMATVQLLCVHADVTGLSEELQQQVQADALALKQLVQRSLHKGSLSVVADVSSTSVSGKALPHISSQHYPRVGAALRAAEVDCQLTELVCAPWRRHRRGIACEIPEEAPSALHAKREEEIVPRFDAWKLYDAGGGQWPRCRREYVGSDGPVMQGFVTTCIALCHSS
jgi:hypothetical protein